MDLTSLQIEGISRSSFNLDNYDFSTKQVSGHRLLIHVSTRKEDGKKNHYSYEIKRVNKSTVNLRCHQRNQKIGHMKKGEIRADGKEHRIKKEPRAQCTAVLTCTVAFQIVEKILDSENKKKSRTKNWTFSDKKSEFTVNDIRR